MFYFWYHSRLSYQIDTPTKNKSVQFSSVQFLSQTNQLYSKATRSKEIKNIQAKDYKKAELRRANANKQTKILKAARNKRQFTLKRAMDRLRSMLPQATVRTQS